MNAEIILLALLLLLFLRTIRREKKSDNSKRRLQPLFLYCIFVLLRAGLVGGISDVIWRAFFSFLYQRKIIVYRKCVLCQKGLWQ